MDLNVILGIAGVMAAWIMLSLVGNERQRQVRDFDARQALIPRKPPADPAKPAETASAAPAAVKQKN